MLGVVFKVFAEADNEIVHGPRGHDAGVTPADFQELFSWERFAPVGDKQFQEFHFLFRQADFACSAGGGGGAKIDPVASENVERG